MTLMRRLCLDKFDQLVMKNIDLIGCHRYKILEAAPGAGNKRIQEVVRQLRQPSAAGFQ